jgi:predicted DNA-binding transcriptional regulator AlpA
MELQQMTSIQFEEMLQKAVETAISKQKENTSNVLLKRESTAARLGVDLSTLWRWDRSGYLKPVRIGRSVYYRLSDIEARERGEIINE